MGDDNTNANFNKRLRESPNCQQSAKRTMSVNSETSSVQEQDSNTLTLSAFKDILAAEFKEQTEKLDNRLISLATKEDISSVKNDVTKLSTGLDNHEKRLEQMEKKQRSRNLIFKNITQKRNYKPYITSLLQNIMGLEHIRPRSIYVLKTFTEKNLVMLLVEFTDNEEVLEIFGKVATLKETNIIIEKDLSTEERKRKGMLLTIRREVLSRAKVNKVNMKISVSENRIKFNSDVFIFNRMQHDFYKGDLEAGVVLRDYLVDEFNVLVDNEYCIIVNPQ